MFTRRKPDVLVVGAGPVGLFTALLLAERGVRVQVVDKDWRSGTRSYALALHAETLRLLDGLHVLGDVLERARRVRRVGLYDRGGPRAAMRIGELAEDHSFLAVLPQETLESILTEALARKGVRVDWCHRVAGVEQDEDGCTARIEKLSKDSVGYIVQHTEWVVSKRRELRVPFVIGADGHASAVRRSLGIEFPQVGIPSEFAVFEFQTDADLGDEMRVVMDETTDVCWPLPGGWCRFSFEQPTGEPAWNTREKDRDLVQESDPLFASLTENRLRELLEERTPWFRGSVRGIRWRMIVRFERRLADSLGNGRIWLAGDAAHMTGPVGIQSMNIGFLEARQLADAACERLLGNGGASPFSGFSDGWRLAWSRLLGVEPGLAPAPDAPTWVAERADRLVSCVPAFGADYARLAAQIGLSSLLPVETSR
ncbi:MAG: hypothetical protein Fur0037_01650 [Planctomycetota bacterium]